MEAKLKELAEGWSVVDGKKLSKKFEFKSFLKTMSFVNAVAWEANRLVHHPDMEVSFSHCIINITTHDAGNVLTDKDFELAMAIDRLF
jgi:4a-hydroxytetrahydrobiopterin dehydratase